jgi:hypothetical protein
MMMFRTHLIKYRLKLLATGVILPEIHGTFRKMSKPNHDLTFCGDTDMANLNKTAEKLRSRTKRLRGDIE